jgi:glycosyltransferase involved in cell wall biosynthesis
MQPYISIVIPAYNEFERIETTIRSATDYFKGKPQAFEVIVVDDGSSDKTAELVTGLMRELRNVKLSRLNHNQGKGAAVKRGMLEANGEVRLFMDADGSTAISELDKFLPVIQQGFDVVVGSRLADGAVKKVKQNFSREILGWVFRKLTRYMMNTSVLDPQNGFKIFTKVAAVKIFSDLQTTGWGFDVEVLMIAKKYGLRVKEIPVTWTNDGRSKMRFGHMVVMLVDLVKIRMRYAA